jgi:hypothetical protein
LIEGVAEQCLGNGLDEMLISHHQATSVDVVVLVVLVVVLVELVAVIECVAVATAGNCTVNEIFQLIFQSENGEYFRCGFIPDFEEEYFCFILDTKEIHFSEDGCNLLQQSTWNILSECPKNMRKSGLIGEKNIRGQFQRDEISESILER